MASVAPASPPAGPPSSFNFPAPPTHIPSPNRQQSTPSSPAAASSPKHHYTPTSVNTNDTRNAHPYAIRTSSTGLLTRSNSVTQDHARHHYVPPSPHSRKDSDASEDGATHAAAKKDKGFGTSRAHGPGHRYSRSLSNDPGPRPLPSPPSTGSTPAEAHTKESSAAAAAAGADQGDLPANPKHWTPQQLSIYLSTALRVRGGGELPTPLAQDIAAFVLRAHINGKTFLRLDEADLEEWHMNPLWCTSLLAASRSLRQNVLKGRVWGFVEQIEGDQPPSPAPLAPSKSRFITRKAVPHGDTKYTDVITTDPGSLYSSADSSSSIDLPIANEDGTPRTRARLVRGKFRNGRVRGMVHSWESGSESGNDSISEEDESSVEESSPAPFAAEDTGSSDANKRALPLPPDGIHRPPLAAPPLIVPGHSYSGSSDSESPVVPLTPPPINFVPPSNPKAPIVGDDDDVPLAELIKAQGIEPRSQKPKKKRGGVDAWLDEAVDGGDDDMFGAGATMKHITEEEGGGSGKGGSKGSGKEGAERPKLGDIFSTDVETATVPAGTAIPAIEDGAKDDEIKDLRSALDESKALCSDLAAKVEEYESRVSTQLPVLEAQVMEEEVRERVKVENEEMKKEDEKLRKEKEERDEEIRRLVEEKERLVKVVEELRSSAATPAPPPPPSPPQELPVAERNVGAVSKLVGLFSSYLPGSGQGRVGARERHKRLEETLGVKTLPGSVVLVGIGICVGALRVLGRSGVGRGRS